MAASSPQEQLQSYILTEFGHRLEGEGLPPDRDLLSDGVVDSMGVMQLISFMEDTFSVSVEDEEITPDNFRSLQTLTNFLSSKGVS